MRHDNEQYRFVAAAVMGRAGDPGAGWDWDAIVRMAWREDVLAALPAELAPAGEVRGFLGEIAQINAQRNAQLMAELEAHAVLLNAAGLEPVLLKGAAYFATGVYQDLSKRLVRDIDLLFAAGDAKKAFGVIEGSGYEAWVPNPTGLVLHHYPALTRVHRVPVEVHHALGMGAGGTLLTAEEVAAESVEMRLGAARVRVPRPEHLMAHLIAHSQLHHAEHERIWPPLRAMVDLVAVGRRFAVDWEWIRARFRARGLTAILETHLLQVSGALGVNPPFAIGGRSARWWYRRALWREPRLRYVDPFYTWARMVAPKLRLSRLLMGSEEGRRYVWGSLLRRSFYRKLMEGFGNG